MKKPQPVGAAARAVGAVRAEARLDGVLGVRHEPDDVARRVQMPAMPRREPFGSRPW